MIPKFRFFGKVADGEMRMVLAESIDFKNGFVYYSYHDYTVEGDDNVYGDTIGFEDCVLIQSTGLFDKNGKEIFEGDVVKCYTVTENGEHEYAGVVCFKDFAFVIVDEKDTYDPLWNYKSGFVGIETEIEIIGNIYQNPELLEGK